MITSPLTLQFSCHQHHWNVLAFQYDCELNKPFIGTVDVIADAEYLDSLMGRWATVTVKNLDDKTERTFGGRIMEGQTVPCSFDTSVVVHRLQLMPEAAHLWKNRRTGIYYGGSVHDIIDKGIYKLSHKELFHNETDYDVLIQKDDNTYPQHPSMVQYMESDSNFFDRELRRHGAWHHFWQDGGGRNTWRFGDMNSQFKPHPEIKVLDTPEHLGAGLIAPEVMIANVINKSVRGCYYDELTGECNTTTADIDNLGFGQTDYLLPFTQLTVGQQQTMTDRVAEAELAGQMPFSGPFQNLNLQAGHLAPMNAEDYGLVGDALLTRVKYQYSAIKDSVKVLGKLRYAEDHHMEGVLLNCNLNNHKHYRPRMLTKAAQTEPRFNGLMSGVFAQTDGDSHTVLPDAIGRIPLIFPMRYTYNCNNCTARYTPVIQEVNTDKAGHSFPYYQDTEFQVGFNHGQLGQPLIVGTAATSETGHIHSDKTQQRSAEILPQGQHWVTGNAHDQHSFMKVGATHSEGDHQSFIMMNNFASQSDPTEKQLDMLQATTANYTHHVTGHFHEQLGGEQTTGNPTEKTQTQEATHWIQGTYLDANQKPISKMDYTITHQNGKQFTGKLNKAGQTKRIKNLKPGTATIQLGNKAKLEKKLKQQRAQLQMALNAILAKTTATAQQEKAAFANENEVERFFTYNLALQGAFEVGLAQGATNIVIKTATGIAHLFKDIAQSQALHDQGMMDTLNGNTKDLQKMDQQSIKQGEKRYGPIVKAMQTMHTIFEDPQTRAMLETFAKAYYDSETRLMLAKQTGEFIGGFIPAIIVAVILKNPDMLAAEANSASADVNQAADKIKQIETTVEALQKTHTLVDAEVDREHTVLQESRDKREQLNPPGK
jgi:uncharacterized protein involved in type VI secretion and phage assembly